MKDFGIQIACMAQLPQIRELLEKSFSSYVTTMGYQLDHTSFPALQPSMVENKIWVAMDSAAIIGTIVVTSKENTWEIEYVGVLPGLQGQGTGRLLIDTVEQSALDNGIGFLTLHTAKSMQALITLYCNLGFVVTHEGMPLHGKDTHPRVYMEKALER